MAARLAVPVEGLSSIQIRAQLLRRPPGVGGAALPGQAFAIMLEEPPSAPAGAAGRRGHWRQSDVKRALAAADQAGLASYRVEIAPDGTISIIVGDPADTAP